MNEDEQPITFRLPKELHERLRDAAWKRRVSMNAFVIEAIESAITRAGTREGGQS